MNQSESIKELAGALAKAQAKLRPAIKDSTNPHFKSKYADLGAIWEACREALTSNGLSVVQMPADSGEGRVALTTILLHASGEYISGTCSTRLQQDSAQGVGSALTYLRRYALAAMVGVVADEDDDGNAASRPQQPSPRQAAAPQRPALVSERKSVMTLDAARAAIAALPAATAEDIAAAEDLDDRDLLRAMYREIKARKNGAVAAADLPL